MKKALALILALAMIFAFCACGNSSQTSAGTDAAPAASSGSASSTTAKTDEGFVDNTVVSETNVQKSDETLIVATSAETVSLTDMVRSGAFGDTAIREAISTALFTLNLYTYEIEYGGFATSVDEIEPGSYRIHCRDDVYYSDGTQMTAKDVLYSYKNFYNAGVQFTKYLDFDKCVAEDDFTLVLTFYQYMPGWQFDLTYYGIYNEDIVNRAGGVEAYDHNPQVGCGKYNFVEWVTGQYVLIERNEDYFDKDYVGYYKYIKFVPIADSASRLMACQSGDVNVATELSVTQAANLDNDPTVEGQMFAIGTVYNLYYNNDEGIFTDPKVREAVTYCVDSEAVNQLINLGKGETVQGFYSSLHPYYKEVLPGGKHVFDPEKGKQLLAEAGYPNGFECTLTCAIPYEPVAVIVQECLRNVGIKVNLNVAEPSVNIIRIRAGEYDMSVATTSYCFERPDAWDLIDPQQIGSANGGPRINIPEMSEWIAMARSSDKEKCEEGWSNIFDYIFENNCLVGLCSQYESYAVTKGLVGLRPYPTQGKYSVIDIHPAG